MAKTKTSSNLNNTGTFILRIVIVHKNHVLQMKFLQHNKCMCLIVLQPYNLLHSKFILHVEHCKEFTKPARNCNAYARPLANKANRVPWRGNISIVLLPQGCTSKISSTDSSLNTIIIERDTMCNLHQLCYLRKYFIIE